MGPGNTPNRLIICCGVFQILLLCSYIVSFYLRGCIMNCINKNAFSLLLFSTCMFVMPIFGSSDDNKGPDRDFAMVLLPGRESSVLVGSSFANNLLTVKIPESAMSHLLTCDNEQKRWFACQPCADIRSKTTITENKLQSNSTQNIHHLFNCTSNKDRFFGACGSCTTIRSAIATAVLVYRNCVPCNIEFNVQKDA